MYNSLEKSYERINNYRLPKFNSKDKDFIFFTAITQQSNIISFISLEKLDNSNIIYQKFIELSKQEYRGFIIQLKFLNINYSFEKKFFINYTLNKNIPNQLFFSNKTTYLISSILLIKNSRSFLPIFYKNYLKYNKKTFQILYYLSQLILKNINIGDIVNINIVSSFILFLYNIRNINDIDLNIKYGSDENFKTKYLKYKFNIFKKKIKKKFNIKLDIRYSVEDKIQNIIKPNYEQFLKWYGNKAKYFYNNYLNNYTFKKFNVKYESEAFYNPDNYFYVFGLKFCSIKYELYRRYESLARYNFKKYCHAKRFAEVIFLVNNNYIKAEIPFYSKQFSDKCFNETQKCYYYFFKKTININTIKDIYNKVKSSKYNIKINESKFYNINNL